MLSTKEHEQKTAALMDGAVRSVALYGLENASTKTISACCGINEAYIYRYFESKEEQSLAAGIFNKQVQQVNEDSEREKALNEMVKTLKKASLDKKSREITDLSQLQKIIMEKKQLETLHITLT